MDTTDDQPMSDEAKDVETRLPVSEGEQRALELYDKLQELRLEIAIINAQQSNQTDEAEEWTTPEEAEAARNELLETRAKYLLRNQVVESVLSANPIIKAVHNGTEASPVERDLLPFIQKRDEAAISAAKTASSAGELRGQSTQAQSDTLRVTRRNVELAGQVLDLVAQVKEKKSGYVHDEKTQGEIQRLEGEMKASRQRWRIMKGITSSVVAGSGVDWARDAALRDMVLDPEDEE